MSNEVYKKLATVQVALKAPKGQRNSFGNYNYRSCEDILEAAKPLCVKNGLVLVTCDDIVNIGDRFYVKAIVKVTDIETGETVESQAFARENDVKKGMDVAQITGASSSYARKYALNALFSLDDTKDADTYKPQQNETEINKINEADSIGKILGGLLKTNEQKTTYRNKILNLKKTNLYNSEEIQKLVDEVKNGKNS